MSGHVNARQSGLGAEDRLDIEELFAKYAWGIDLADADMALSCFTDDAEFDHLWQGRVQGHAAILENLKELWYGRQHWWFGRQHLFNHFLMTGMKTEQGEQAARVKSFFQIVQFNVEYRTNFLFGVGTRDDVCVKRGDLWLFKELRVNAWTSREMVPWQGELKLVPGPGQPPPRAKQQAAE
jgi:SnoaL-like domain